MRYEAGQRTVSTMSHGFDNSPVAVLEECLASGSAFSGLRHSLRQDPDVRLARMTDDQVSDAATRVREIQRRPTGLEGLLTSTTPPGGGPTAPTRGRPTTLPRRAALTASEARRGVRRYVVTSNRFSRDGEQRSLGVPSRRSSRRAAVLAFQPSDLVAEHLALRPQGADSRMILLPRVQQTQDERADRRVGDGVEIEFVEWVGHTRIFGRSAREIRRLSGPDRPRSRIDKIPARASASGKGDIPRARGAALMCSARGF